MVNDSLTSSATVGIISAYAIQWIKKSKSIPWVNEHTQSLNRFLSGMIAFASAAGIYLTWNHAAGTLTITGLTAANAFHFLTHGIEQWAIQQMAYKGVVAGHGHEHEQSPASPESPPSK